MTMRRFTFVQAPFLSFYSKPFYQDVADHWQVAAPPFLLVLLALSWVPFMFGVYGNWSKFMATEAPPLLEQMPVISISEGIVTAIPEGPTYVKDRTSGKVFAIIDTTGTVVSLEHDEATLLLTRTQVVVKKGAAETRTYDLSHVKRFSLDRQRLQRWLEVAAAWAPPSLYVLLVLFSGIYRFVQALIYGAVGLWFAKRRNVAIEYSAAVRLSIMSLCPTIILKAVLQTAGITFRFYGFVLLVLGLSYLWFGVGACRAEERVVGTSGA
jgi:Protein of unknown function (DUF1189)